MTLERRNPVPPGRYWVDVFDAESTHPATVGQNMMVAFRDWLKRNGAAIRVDTTETIAANNGAPARDFYIFRVLTPVKWEGPGFPERAANEVQSSQDTEGGTDPEKDPLDQLGDALGGAGQATKQLVTIAAFGLGALLLVNIFAATRAAKR